MNDSEKLRMIERIMMVHEMNFEDDEGDKYLSDEGFLKEAIGDVLSGDRTWVIDAYMAAGA